jgi:PAS domain-containing protein
VAPGWKASLIGLIAGGGVLFAIAETWYRLRGIEGLGMGDVKMLAMIGAFLGWQLMLVTLVLSSFAGSVIGVGIIALGRGGMKSMLPFGTFLASVRSLPPSPAMRSSTGTRLLSMTQQGYAFLGMTAIVAGLAAVLVFAMLRFAAGARDARRNLMERGGESPMLAAALHEAVAKLKAQEQAMTARAAASEQLSGDIVESLTAGLLVVDRSGRVEIFNGAGRAMVGVTGNPIGFDYHKVLAALPPLMQLIEECLLTARPIVRRSVRSKAGRTIHLGVTVSPLGKAIAPSGRARPRSADRAGRRRRRRRAGCHLPVLGLDCGRRAGRAVAPERDAGEAR